MRKGKHPENTQGIICHYNSQLFVIEQKYRLKYEQQNEFLQFNRKTQEVRTIKSFERTAFQSKKFSAFLGIVDLQSQKFLLFCDEAIQASSIENFQIFQISSLFFLGYTDERVLKKRPQRKEIYRKIRQYYIMLKSGFYFSYSFNITLPLRLQKEERIAKRFTWNIRFLQELQSAKVPRNWLCPIIQGFSRSFEVYMEGAKIGYVLVSRRSNKKGGTRYFDRGVDDDGYVANYCETEQIVRLGQYTMSDLQIRGSIPIFFEQVGLTTTMKLNRGFELTHQVYRKHISKITRDHKRVFFANLLSVGKRGERMLIEQLQNHMKKDVNPNLRYLYYDFHHQVSGGHYEKVDLVMSQIRNMKINLRYYVVNTKTGVVMEEPMGTFRTNCLDCLDRTNFFQAKLALITVEALLKQVGVSNKDLLREMRQNSQDNDFIKNYRHIWADNGDAISFHYTGTGSTHTDITRDGKRGWLGNFKHKYKTVTRFYNQNFWDFYKMKLVHLILGQGIPTDNISMSKLLRDRQNEYVRRQSCQIYIFTWKAPKKVPKSLFLLPNTPRLIVFSLQDYSEEEKWNKLIFDSVDKDKYMVVQQTKSLNNMLKIFSLRELKPEISGVEHGKVKFTSYYNTVISNKCAVFIRFTLCNTRMVFVSCQLEKGRDFQGNRIRNLRQIHENAFQIEDVGVQKSSSIISDDVIFLFGNMNTTVSNLWKGQFSKFNDLSNFSQQQKQLTSKMMQTDEFQQLRQNLLQLREYQQQEISFPPTYRYINGCFDPEQSGWPDRIWYSSENKIVCNRYGVIEELRNEHVPVVGMYSVDIERIDRQLKDRICAEILENQNTKLGLVQGAVEEDSQQELVKL